MKEITFQEVGMENFGPYVDQMILTFENDKLTLITGPNGIGKTMSLEAIPFTLYGETCKKARGDDVVNTRVGKNCHTWVKFSIDNDKYLVDRYHKYSKLGNTVTIKKNDDEPYKKGHREVVPEIERLICSKKSFTNTLMFGQRVKDFFTDLVDSDKKEIFRKILNLDIYTEWYKEADNDLKEIRKRLQKALESIGIESGILSNVEEQIENIIIQQNDFENIKQENLRSIRKSIEDQNRLLDKWSNERSSIDLTVDIEDISKQIENVKTQIASHESEKETYVIKLMSSRDTKISEIKESAYIAKNKITSELKIEYEKFQASNKEEIHKIENLISKLTESSSDVLSKISAYKAQRGHIQKDIDKLINSLEMEGGATCPVCLQTMDDECKKHLQNEYDKLLTEYKKVQNKEKKLESELTKIRNELETRKLERSSQDVAYTKYVNELKEKENKRTSEIDIKLSTAIAKVNEMAEVESVKIRSEYLEQIENLKNKLRECEEVKKQQLILHERLKEIDNTIEDLKQSINNNEMKFSIEEDRVFDTTHLNSYKNKKVEIKNKLVEINKIIEKLTKEEMISTFWKTAWSPTGIPSMLIDEAIPFMNEKVSEYLDRLTNGRYIVSFDTLAETKSGEFRDKISVNVLDTYTRANSRIQLSGGQTRLVDIATILTLGDLQATIQDLSINILLFDEIFDSLDEENIGFVSNILSQLKIGKSIYLISHTQIDQLEADEVLEYK